MKHLTIDLPDAVIAKLVSKNKDRIEHYAQMWMAGEKENYSMVEYGEFVAGIMQGLAPIPEIKRELRLAIRRLEKDGRGGW